MRICILNRCHRCAVGYLLAECEILCVCAYEEAVELAEALAVKFLAIVLSVEVLIGVGVLFFVRVLLGKLEFALVAAVGADLEVADVPYV